MSSDKSYVVQDMEFSVVDLIRRRAYELFEARGRLPGHDVEDWLQAEREMNHPTGSFAAGISYEAIET